MTQATDTDLGIARSRGAPTSSKASRFLSFLGHTRGLKASLRRVVGWQAAAARPPVSEVMMIIMAENRRRVDMGEARDSRQAEGRALYGWAEMAYGRGNVPAPTLIYDRLCEEGFKRQVTSPA